MTFYSHARQRFFFAVVFSVLFTLQPLNAVDSEKIPENLQMICNAYPEISFTITYDYPLNDWKIKIHRPKSKKTSILYWAEGRILPADKIDQAELYWPIMYSYPEEIPDPKDFTKEHIEEIRRFTSEDSRRNTAGTPLDFFDAVYDSANRLSVESHISRVSFLGKYTNIHSQIAKPLARVEKRILQLAKEDPEVQTFINRLARCDSYNWREIGDRNSRSFHSYGIAVDILPKGWGKKNIYWAWRRDIDPDNWMNLSLERRWMPPVSVIKAFEKEGFIWGGKWIIWDDMHFEYHPELIDYNNLR